MSVNPRYRIWTPEHTLMKVPPLLLEDQMELFYGRLAELVARAEERFPSWNDTIEAMAYADLMTDGELRPWLDGCGRVATALVMWIARVLGAPLPLFAASKEVHKMTMRDLDKSTGSTSWSPSGGLNSSARESWPRNDVPRFFCYTAYSL
jgi:hypothetical protein